MRSIQVTLLIHQLVEAFNCRTLPKSAWTHEAHLRVGLWYVWNYSAAEAIEKLRERIKAYNLACGVQNTASQGYHETITRFYVLLIEQFIERVDTSRSLDELGKELIYLYGDNRLILEYYSSDRLFSDRARFEWLEPDLKAIRLSL